ncbi:Por secretion system C-terminal sorting domain-containing protein [Chitinophaga sp. CF118]|uniref:T9SS type A sorting domain-containing protein n=1 Tax=Chitinophaga sp. CF118 TaxID=1884367 RepID=UPI0008EEB218|nr:T9SS type A sorting domain-containing protein [Chitinophaga sp. CF118]SFD26933.1 Por secretion system C-terminal sorting domain-containing protein [Chitinophaga sp. CF118]
MKQRLFQAIVYISLCMLPAAVFGQSVADTSETPAAIESSVATKNVAVKQAEQVVVRIYPNPAVDKVTYTFPAGIQKHLLQVTDMGGRTILNLIVGNIGTQNTINTSSWRSGVYFVSINSSTFSKTFKLMKQ